ncbi:MAG TPA: hypothetical protein VEG44_02635 [Candidatus Acidoferrales bacterium]|nr:hypothetical protein [Candidatus Acidoferrales bacterium]
MPYTLSKLAVLPTRIYQALHEGALAFLAVVAPSYSATEGGAKISKNAVNSAQSLP